MAHRKSSEAYLCFTTGDNGRWNNFVDILFLIDNCFQIDCCNNDWGNLSSILGRGRHLDVLWTVHRYLKFAPAHLPKRTSQILNHIYMLKSICIRVANLTRRCEGQLENLDIDNQDGPFMFLLTRKSSRALSMNYSIHYYLHTIKTKVTHVVLK